MYPLGCFALQRALRQRGLRCEIVNVASLMLQHEDLDVDRLLARLEAPIYGIDLHWMAHSHGALELAARVKAIHPDALTLLGGISATLYAEELIRHPAVDLLLLLVQRFAGVVQVAGNLPVGRAQGGDDGAGRIDGGGWRARHRFASQPAVQARRRQRRGQRLRCEAALRPAQ